MDHHTFLKYTRKSMVLIGVWKLNINNEYLSLFYRFWKVLSQSYYITFCISFIIGMKDVLNDKKKEADMEQYLLVTILLLWKLMMSQSERIQKEIDKIMFWEANMNHHPGLKRIYTKNTEYNHKIFFFLAVMYFSTCSQYIINGYVKWTEMELNDHLVSSLIFTAWFPFDVGHYFDAVYFFQLSMGVFAGTYSLAFDTLIISLIMVATTKLRILGYKFEHFGSIESGCPSHFLKNWILEHQEIIKYVENLNTSMKWYFFCDFIVKSYHISLVLVSIMNGNKSASVVPICLLIYILTQLWCFYYHANELIIESTNLACHIFQSKWYDQDLHIQKNLLIVMMRSQRPLELHIGNLKAIENGLFVKTDLSLEVCCNYLDKKILRNAYLGDDVRGTVLHLN